MEALKGIFIIAAILGLITLFVWASTEEDRPPAVGALYYYSESDRDPFQSYTDDTVKIISVKNKWLQFQCRDMTIRNETIERFKRFMTKCKEQP